MENEKREKETHKKYLGMGRGREAGGQAGTGAEQGQDQSRIRIGSRDEVAARVGLLGLLGLLWLLWLLWLPRRGTVGRH